MRKSLFVLILLSLLSSGIAQVVTSPRVEDWDTHFGLPGLVDMLGSEEVIAPVDDQITVIELPATHVINYAGKTYSSLTLYSTGIIAFGSTPVDLNRRFTPYVVPFSGDFMLNEVKVKHFAEEFDNRTDYYTVIEIGPFFSPYSHSPSTSGTYICQIYFYSDGEIQIQMWIPGGSNFSLTSYTYPASSWYEWMRPRFFDGKFERTLEGHVSNLYSIYSESSGLRQGWVAKSFNNKGVVFREEIQGDGKKNLLIDFGLTIDPGGLLAYDYSREHPTVGGIHSVIFQTQRANGVGTPVYFWYFNEFFIERTDLAYYPNIQGERESDGSDRVCIYDTNLILNCEDPRGGYVHASDYHASWTKSGYGSSLYSMVDIHAAPAFKLQLTGNQYENRVLRVRNLEYRLSQPPSVQFRAPQGHKLTFNTFGGGIVRAPELSGRSPYTIYRNEVARAEIIADPGKEIEMIAVNGNAVFFNGEFVKSQLARFFSGLSPDRSSVTFSTPVTEDIMVAITFTDCTGRTLPPVTPAMVKTEQFLPDGSGRKSAGVSIQDGLGRTVQTQDSLSSSKYLIGSVYYDELGNPLYTPLSFVRDTSGFGYIDMACSDCITRSNAYHNGSDKLDRPDAFGRAYIEHDAYYGNASGLLGSTAGVGDAAFALSDNQGEMWQIPVSSETDFFPKEYLNTDEIRDRYRLRMQDLKQGRAREFSNLLTVSLDSEHRYSQSIANALGQMVATRVYDGETPVTTRYVYNDLGQLTMSYPDAGGMALAVYYEYDALGRVIQTRSPDRGTIDTRYDSLGRARFVRDARQKARGENHFTANIYDVLGRLTHTGEVKGTHSFETPDADIPVSALTLTSETIYGKPTLERLVSIGIHQDASLFISILESMTGIRPTDIGAVIAYDGDGNAVSLKMSSFDRLGRTIKRWVIYGVGTPAVQLSYGYNNANELTSSNFSEWSEGVWTIQSSRTRLYDRKGRLTNTNEDGAPLANYEYSDKGNVKAKHYYDRGTEVYTQNTERDIHGRPLKVNYTKNGQLFYAQELTYTSPASGQLAAANHNWNSISGTGNVSHAHTYAYDDLGRLASVGGSLPGTYEYDIIGRLIHKAEQNTVSLYYDETNYHPSSVRMNNSLHSLTFHTYGASGNLWKDEFAQATYQYNSRNLPEMVRRHTQIPGTLTEQDVDNGVTAEEEYERISMAYDESGSRIWQNVVNKGHVNRTEATLSGVGVYVKEDFTSEFELDRLDLIGGGFRQGKTGDALFPVKDVQGNVRGYAGKSGLVSAYGYYAFGTVDEIAENTSGDTKRWQGKEFDGRHGKYYFGARFFDPAFGLWMTPDPAGQFANPYTYGGDPLNYVDPNGEWVHILVGAIVGGVIGTVGGAIQCAYSDVSCSRAIVGGNIVGSAAGAAAAATGGAVTGAFGTGIGATAASGAAAGAVGSGVNYAGNAMISGEFNNDDFAWAL
ncbi:MAG: hypothetical protein LBR60_02050, partial [Fibrobacter sp.]|nr:hypothetical protein [Fibrobacter sp.]